MEWRDRLAESSISTHSLTRRLTNEALGLRPMGEYFNSQPHKEADGSQSQSSVESASISTHSLTRRLTLMSIMFVILHDISTHSLTRRLTLRRSLNGSSTANFNSQPHKEADPTGAGKTTMVKLISTHSLTRRLTALPRSFQKHLSHFNSQPHKEADSNFRQKHIYPKLIFLLIIHISLIFYSNHHILNYFSCKLYVFPGANVLEYFCELTFRTIILRYL